MRRGERGDFVIFPPYFYARTCVCPGGLRIIVYDNIFPSYRSVCDIWVQLLIAAGIRKYLYVCILGGSVGVGRKRGEDSNPCQRRGNSDKSYIFIQLFTF